MIPPTSIDGTDITGATIDGTDVQEITVDGDVVFTAGQTLPVAFSNLVAWYPFDSAEYGGSNADDVTAIIGGSGDDTAYDGTVNGATYLSTGGKTDINAGSNSGAFDFQNGDGIINTGLTRFNGSTSNDFTVVGWIFPTSYSTGDNVIIGIESEWFITIDEAAGDSLRTSIFGDNNAGRSPAIPINQWLHFAVYWDPGTEIKTYFDGQLVDTYSSTVTSSGSNELRIGDSTVGFFTGKIEDIRIYDGELSQPQIESIYDNTEA